MEDVVKCRAGRQVTGTSIKECENEEVTAASFADLVGLDPWITQIYTALIVIDRASATITLLSIIWRNWHTANRNACPIIGASISIQVGNPGGQCSVSTFDTPIYTNPPNGIDQDPEHRPRLHPTIYDGYATYTKIKSP